MLSVTFSVVGKCRSREL